MRSAKRRHDNIWTVVLTEFAGIPAAGQVDYDIVAPTDWERSSAGLERGTLLSVRGYMSMTNRIVSESLGSGSVMGYLAKYDIGETSSAPNVVNTYAEEDILWTGGRAIPFTNVDTPWNGWHHEFDVKAMRRITSGDNIRLVLKNLTVNLIYVTMVIRGLVRVGS